MQSLVPLLESGLASDCFDQQPLVEAPPRSVQAAERTCKPGVQPNNSPTVSTLSPISSQFWSPFWPRVPHIQSTGTIYDSLQLGGNLPTSAQYSKDDFLPPHQCPFWPLFFLSQCLLCPSHLGSKSQPLRLLCLSLAPRNGQDLTSPITPTSLSPWPPKGSLRGQADMSALSNLLAGDHTQASYLFEVNLLSCKPNL